MASTGTRTRGGSGSASTVSPIKYVGVCACEEDDRVVSRVYKRLLMWAHQREEFAGKTDFKKDIICALTTKYVEYELAVHRRVQAPAESIANSPDDAESPGQHVIHGSGGAKETNLQGERWK